MKPPKPAPRSQRSTRSTRRILVVDAGGSHVKLMVSGSKERIKFASGPRFTPRQLMAGIRKYAGHWQYDAVSLGLPFPIVRDKAAREPNNLGRGWTKFDFPTAFGKPCKLINDAAMQALGSYDGGRMLFIGLGTGLGSAMILDGALFPLELGDLSYTQRFTFENMLGREGRKRLGQKKWEEALERIVAILRNAFVTDYVVIGGGNARKVAHLPRDARLGDNRNAFLGGLRLWGLGSGRAITKSPLIC
jgi:polyphosphate glucokinase